ncbi:hypothetical protein Droror1_Dr00005806 [Drosera rotundifolia]
MVTEGLGDRNAAVLMNLESTSVTTIAPVLPAAPAATTSPVIVQLQLQLQGVIVQEKTVYQFLLIPFKRPFPFTLGRWVLGMTVAWGAAALDIKMKPKAAAITALQQR